MIVAETTGLLRLGSSGIDSCATCGSKTPPGLDVWPAFIVNSRWLLSRSDPPSRLRVVTDSARYVLKDLRVTADSLFGTTTTTGYEPPPGKPVGLALADVRSLEVEKSDAGSAVIVVLVLVTGAVVGLSLGLRGLMGN
jgi:hypothetical protein